MRDTLLALATGELSVAEAEARLAGYATNDAGRFDATRWDRSGVPEGILGDGKTPSEVASLAVTAVETTGQAIATRVDETQATAIEDALADAAPAAIIEHNPRTQVVVVHDDGYEPPRLAATVCVVSAGTSDRGPAGEAATVAREMGATVKLIEDVGVASLVRLVDELSTLRAADVLVVAAGREGALPTVVAGLVDTPVIALPVGTGYGYGGDGAAALAGVLQSCTVLSVVNIDAGFVAGAQAGLIARAIDTAK